MKRFITILLVAMALLSSVAEAHTQLVNATPANGSTVAAAPIQVMLLFARAVTLTALSIQKTGEKVAQKLGPLPKAAAEHFAVALPKLTSGNYLVKYRVLGDDGHVAAGTTEFTISEDAKPAGAKGTTVPAAATNGAPIKKMTTPAPTGK